MGTFDLFAAELRCPRCSSVSPKDNSTSIHTTLRDEPEMATVRVGDRFEIDPDVFELELDYLVLRTPKAGEPIRVVESWHCPSCKTGHLWVEVTVQDHRVVEMQNVKIDRATLARVHALTPKTRGYVSLRSDRPVDELPKDRAELLELLLEHASREPYNA